MTPCVSICPQAYYVIVRLDGEPVNPQENQEQEVCMRIQNEHRFGSFSLLFRTASLRTCHYSHTPKRLALTLHFVTSLISPKL